MPRACSERSTLGVPWSGRSSETTPPGASSRSRSTLTCPLVWSIVTSALRLASIASVRRALERRLDEGGLARQLGRARHRQLHVLADQRLSEVERVDAQLLDAGRDELGRIAGFFRRRRGEGRARHGDLARGDEVDLDLVA